MYEVERRFWVNLEKAGRIWADIGDVLKKKGFTWPIYLRLLRARRDLILRYGIGELSYSLLLGEVSNAASGPLGRYILETGG